MKVETRPLPPLKSLPTAALADACLRLDLQLRLAPPGMRPVLAGTCVAGRVLPARHYGSVDVFLEALENCQPGDVLVIDNGGRCDEACIGDLVTLEAQTAGITALIVWGQHRDTAELRQIGLPVFSYGHYSTGPCRLDHAEPEALVSARFGSLQVTRADVVAADDDGALFVPAARVEEIWRTAEEIVRRERVQAETVRQGTSLRRQFRFAEYLENRSADASYTFRRHLRQIGGAVEE